MWFSNLKRKKKQKQKQVKLEAKKVYYFKNKSFVGRGPVVVVFSHLCFDERSIHIALGGAAVACGISHIGWIVMQRRRTVNADKPLAPHVGCVG